MSKINKDNKFTQLVQKNKLKFYEKAFNKGLFPF